MVTSYEVLSTERKQLQKEGAIPEWMVTGGWQMVKEKYLHADTLREQYSLMARTAAKHLQGTPFEERAEERFFNMFWKGHVSPSSPVLANLGTTRGMPISCSGNYINDSIDGFYDARRENAILTKFGFGTSSCLSDIRYRGAPISRGGFASGVMPLYKGFTRDMQEVA